MSSGIIENAEELKSLYLQTDITNTTAVQSAIKDITENVYVIGKEKYLVALNSATPATLSKAQKYHKMVSSGGIKSTITKNLGWIIMAIFAIWMALQSWETDSTWQSFGFWVGVGIQIYIAVLKSAWKKLTLSGTAIHSAVNSSTVSFSSSRNNTAANTNQTAPVFKETSVKYIFCSECGHKNKEGAQFCENCGRKL